jgi:glutathione transport system ATP-binding protein
LRLLNATQSETPDLLARGHPLRHPDHRSGAVLLPDQKLLDVQGLCVTFDTDRGPSTVVRGLDLSVAAGETVALVGESGSGKSVTALAITRLLDYAGGRIEAGRILFTDRADGQRDLATLSPEAMRGLRGPELAMVFQEPMTSLNPVLTVWAQIAETVMLHQGLDPSGARAEARRLLERVRVPDAASQLDRYPFQLSGGMRQRVMIAIALSCRPRLLIADEPTTALDVTVQAQVLRLIATLQAELDMGLIFITHDMGVVAEIADRVVVMKSGEKVEEGDVAAIFAAATHPYTRTLLAAVPVLGSLGSQPLPMPFAEPDARPPVPQDTARPGVVLAVRDLTTRFALRRGLFSRLVGRIHAVEGVSFDLHAGETLGIVGESGCGKSTMGRSIVRLETPESGTIELNGRDITALDRSTERQLHRDVQLVFQDPFASLDPRLTIGFSVAEPIRTHRLLVGPAIEKRVQGLLEQVGLPRDYAWRYPHELSGGQRQRVCIARALASGPKVIIADEAVAALDVSIRAQVVNLLMDLQARLGVAYLFISHDMAVVERIAHRVAVMYLGQVVEIGPRQAVFGDPRHPYTKRLLAAVPVPDPARRSLHEGVDDNEIPSPLRRPDDSPVVAPLVRVGEGHFVARHRVGGLY